MVSDKIFHIHDAWFNLPDDFNGTCGEALMLLAKYRLEIEKQHSVTKQDDDTDNFVTLMSNNKQKGVITYSFGRLDKEENKYVNCNMMKTK